MQKIESWKIIVFIGSLLVVAGLINNVSLDWRRTSARTVLAPPAAAQRPQVTVLPPKKTAIEIAAEHANYVARYLNPAFSGEAGMKEIAIVVVSEEEKMKPSLAAAISGRLQSATVKAVPSLFTPSFVSDGLFREAFEDSIAVANRLDLTNRLDALLLARESVQYVTNVSLEGVITSKLRLDGITRPLVPGNEGRTWTFTANGAGFKPQDARLQAEERLLQEIATDDRVLRNSLPSINH